MGSIYNCILNINFIKIKIIFFLLIIICLSYISYNKNSSYLNIYFLKSTFLKYGSEEKIIIGMIMYFNFTNIDDFFFLVF